jgi:Zn ribbon nucleic-acid-binding protein
VDTFSPEMVRKKKAPSRRELSIARWAEMARKKKAPGRKEAHRFCFECGRRPLPGVHRYQLASRWEEYGVPFVRCTECRSIARAPDNQPLRLRGSWDIVALCVSCDMLARQDMWREEENGLSWLIFRSIRARKRTVGQTLRIGDRMTI